MSDRENLLVREKEILRMISIFSAKNLSFVVIGGYAIATYKHRFSIDLDLVIKENNIVKFEEILEKEGYSLAYSKELSLMYGEEFKRFAKKVKGFLVHVDLLINGLISRTTNSVWSFDYVLKYSKERSLDSVTFFAPEKELLIAMKIHSGRFADIRDIVALMDKSNIEPIKKHVSRGNKDKLKKTIEREISFLENPNFVDSFKGIFGAHVFKESLLEESKDVLNRLFKFLQ